MRNPENIISGILVVAWALAVIVGTAGVLRKAGRPMWRALIPGLNAYELCKTAGVSGWWVLTIFVPGANIAACFYVAIRLAERFGASDHTGIALGVTGFGLLPLLAFGSSELINVPGKRLDQPTLRTTAGSKTVLTAGGDQRRSAKVRMIVLSMVYGLCLICVPGLVIIGAMAFDGVSQITPPMEVLLALAALAPISLVVALIGGWVLYHRQQYRWAIGLSALPILNAVALIAGFVASFV